MGLKKDDVDRLVDLLLEGSDEIPKKPLMTALASAAARLCVEQVRTEGGDEIELATALRLLSAIMKSYGMVTAKKMDITMPDLRQDQDILMGLED